MSKRTFLFPECTTWARRSGCVAVWLVAAGLYGCWGEDAWQHVPAPDDFQHAHVLHPDYGSDDGAYMLSTAAVGSSSPNLIQGWTPLQFQQAYHVPSTQANNKPAGYGAKVAVITAYHYSNLQYDLNKFASKFSLKPITLNIINQAGVVTNSNLAIGSCLAVQMINTVSPGATVYVIEAKSVSQNDIRTAMQTAVNLGVNVILMPFGADEGLTHNNYGPAPGLSVAGVVWIAPSGNDNYPSFPATHPSVIAVGGTTAQLDSSNNLYSETAWANAAAGISMLAMMPSYQMIPSVQQHNTTANRSVPDVAFHANPQYGAQVYTSIAGGYLVVGGASVSAAFFTGVVANVLASRKSKGKPKLTSSPGTGHLLQDSLYRLMSTNGGPTNSTVLNDVVDGFAGAGAYPAGPGYDIATGLGSLNVQKFIEYMDTQ